MIISDHIMIGEAIAYRADAVLQSLRERKPCGYPVWYAVVTAPEPDNLLYILNGMEIRHPFYWQQELRLLGLAGSREEAGQIVLNLVQSGYNKGEIQNMKQYLETL